MELSAKKQRSRVGVYGIDHNHCEAKIKELRSRPDDLLSLKFQKYPNEDTCFPLIRKNEFESGTGHNSLMVKDGRYYVIYHGRDNDVKNGKGDTRTARIAEISVDKEKLEVIHR